MDILKLCNYFYKFAAINPNDMETIEELENLSSMEPMRRDPYGFDAKMNAKPKRKRRNVDMFPTETKDSISLYKGLGRPSDVGLKPPPIEFTGKEIDSYNNKIFNTIEEALPPIPDKIVDDFTPKERSVIRFGLRKFDVYEDEIFIDEQESVDEFKTRVKNLLMNKFGLTEEDIVRFFNFKFKPNLNYQSKELREETRQNITQYFYLPFNKFTYKGREERYDLKQNLIKWVVGQLLFLKRVSDYKIIQKYEERQKNKNKNIYDDAPEESFEETSYSLEGLDPEGEGEEEKQSSIFDEQPFFRGLASTRNSFKK